MQIELFTNKHGQSFTNIFTSVELVIWHIERKDKLDSIIEKLQQLSALKVVNEYGHVLHAYFDSEKDARNAVTDIRVLTGCSYEMNIGKYCVTQLMMRGEN